MDSQKVVEISINIYSEVIEDNLVWKADVFDRTTNKTKKLIGNKNEVILSAITIMDDYLKNIEGNSFTIQKSKKKIIKKTDSSIFRDKIVECF